MLSSAASGAYVVVAVAAASAPVILVSLPCAAVFAVVPYVTLMTPDALAIVAPSGLTPPKIELVATGKV